MVRARLLPLISSQEPGANVSEPPKSLADLTEVIDGTTTGQGATAFSVNCTLGRLVPTTVAVTTTGPAWLPDVSVTAACPLTSVRVLLAESVPPLPGVTLNVTVTPGTPAARPVNCTLSGLASGWPVKAVCLSPSRTVKLTGVSRISLRIVLPPESAAYTSPLASTCRALLKNDADSAGMPSVKASLVAPEIW
ncbi:MAG TPA: hypothetical protein VML19_07580 [Verrucomicrobiae bacterium]|nr:hypothetical protein [Verrucomicrobiae bacterium]